MLDTLRHEAISDMEHAYALGKEFLQTSSPEIKPLIDKMDGQGIGRCLLPTIPPLSCCQCLATGPRGRARGQKNGTFLRS